MSKWLFTLSIALLFILLAVFTSCDSSGSSEMTDPDPDPNPGVTLQDDIQATESAIASLNQQLDVLEGGSFSRRVKAFLG